VSFKEHPEEVKVAEYPSGTPSALNLDDTGSLVVSVANQIVLPESDSGSLEVVDPTVQELLLELIRQVRKSNMYLALLTGEEVQDSDI
jgi:hypothetical protein